MCKDDNKHILEICYHCGNHGLLEVVGKHNHTFGGPTYNTFGFQDGYDLIENFTWLLLKCPVCNMVSLTRKYDNEDLITDEVQVLYPRTKGNLVGLPAHIKEAYESALKIEKISISMCLLAMRKTLEAICRDKNAKGNSLDEMVQDLIVEKILPESLKDACWIIRYLGNEAAHDNFVSIQQRDIEIVIGFMESIINYIYSQPKIINNLKNEILDRKTMKKRSN